jgi:hypothetical protein
MLSAAGLVTSNFGGNLTWSKYLSCLPAIDVETNHQKTSFNYLHRNLNLNLGCCILTEAQISN